MNKSNGTEKKITGAENVFWNLGELFSGIDDPKVEIIIANAKLEAEKFVGKYKGKLFKLSAEELKIAYENLESLLSPLYRLSQYSQLLFSVNTQDEEVKKLISRVDEELSNISNLIIFFDLELGMLEKDIYSRLQSSKELTNYSYKVKRTYETAKYNL